MDILLIVHIRSNLTHLHDFQLLVLLPQFKEITFFICTNRINLLNLKQSSDSLVIVARGFFKLPSFYILVKQESITSWKLVSQDFWQIANSVLNKGKSAIPPLFYGPEVLSSASDKAKLLAKTFSMNSNLDELGISLPVFSSRPNLKLYNIPITPKIVKKVITNCDSSKASAPDCIPVVVLKNCKP